MKKLYCFIFMLQILFAGFSQSYMLKSEISPFKNMDGSRFTVTATVMDNDTWCQVIWPDPVGPYPELWYDDGEADDYFIYANAGSMNALKFIPYHDNYIVTGGRIYVGEGYFPGPFLGTSFRVLVYDDDGENGFPGTVLDSMEVTVDNYEWVEFEGLTAEITEGNFYLAMKQTAPSPNSAPIGVDTDNPTYFRSYSYFQGAPGWVLSPLQDFMIRAWIVAYNEPSREIDYFELVRFSSFDPNGSPLLGDTTIIDTITVSEYDDFDWDGLPAGLYAYGVKTHFTGGEWSDYDVSNLVTHVFYPFPPACFFQSDTGNQQLVICPPVDLNGTLPNFFIGFNLYVDGNFYTFLPPSVTSYFMELPGPGIYSCMLTAVYELSLFGYPDETTESLPLFTDYAVRFGNPLPFLEQWNLGTFETNNWITEASNWSISGQVGNPSPAAEFTWDPIQADYSLSLESYPFQADSMTEGQIYLDFDIKLDNVVATGNELLLVQVWNWENQAWSTVNTYSNEEGSFDWLSEHLDITDLAMHQIFKIRFAAGGENSINILSWLIDNIHIYRDCSPPLNLEAYLFFNPFGMYLNWEAPNGISTDQWIHWDDGVNYNAVGIGAPTEMDVAARWEPGQLTEFEDDSITQISFFPNEVSSSYKVRVWIGAGAANLVVDQLVTSPIIGQWNYITLDTPVSIDITQELWVGYQFTGPNGYPVGVDDGPAIDGFGNMIQFGGKWQTLLEINPDLDYNWNIEAFIQQNLNNDTLLKYAIYRSDNNLPYYLRDYTDQIYYLDDSSICEPLGSTHDYKITALYFGETDTCESGFSNVEGDFCEGINDANQDSYISIYPNPCNDLLKIESSEEIEMISIFNSFGELMVKNKVDGKQAEIAVKDYPPGVYLVRVETGKETISRKVVVMH